VGRTLTDEMWEMQKSAFRSGGFEGIQEMRKTDKHIEAKKKHKEAAEKQLDAMTREEEERNAAKSVYQRECHRLIRATMPEDAKEIRAEFVYSRHGAITYGDAVEEMLNSKKLPGGKEWGRFSRRTKAALKNGLEFVREVIGSQKDFGVGFWYSSSAGFRASASKELGSVSLSVDDSAETVVHEIGHHFEYRVQDAPHACFSFLRYRFEKHNSQFRPMKAYAESYNDDEVGNEDGFSALWEKASSAAYNGKIYFDKEPIVGNPAPQATEVLSMGLQKMYSDPAGFASADYEYFAFTLATCRGEI